MRAAGEPRGASPRPLSPAQALQTLIWAFSRERELPDNLRQLETIYRSTSFRFTEGQHAQACHRRRRRMRLVVMARTWAC